MPVIKPALQYPELIAYFLGANNYCWIFFRNGRKRLLAKPISYFGNQLPNFIRVHKTCLLNPTYVETLHEPPRKKMGGEIQLDSGEVFPVSRRRWNQVLASMEPYISSANHTRTKGDSDLANSMPVAHPTTTALPSILLITDDEKATKQTRQLMENKWPLYQLDTTQKSAHLGNLLRNLSLQEQPALLLLDARKTTQDRLVTLQHLKEDPTLKRIPIILIVSPSDQSVIEGYDRKANSVISVSNEAQSFAHVIDRVCQFWLHTVALPTQVNDV